MIIKLIIIYGILSVLFTVIEYKTVRKTCRIWEHPKLDYCLIRGIFFPLVVIKKVYEYIIK